MDLSEMRARFDREMRLDPPKIGGYHTEKDGSVVRLVGPEGWCILYARPAPGDADRLVAEQLRAFGPAGRTLEWKVYSHDALPELARALNRSALKAKPHETLMAFDLEAGKIPGEPRTDVTIRAVHEDSEFRDMVAVDEAAFGRTDPVHNDEIRQRLEDPGMGVFVAYVRGRPAAGGRVETFPGRTFAGIFGGGTVPEFRRRGIYRDLVRVRAEFARQRGARYLFVEAIDTTSRPLLERIGFVELAGIDAWESVPAGGSAEPDH